MIINVYSHSSQEESGVVARVFELSFPANFRRCFVQPWVEVFYGQKLSITLDLRKCLNCLTINQSRSRKRNFRKWVSRVAGGISLQSRGGKCGWQWHGQNIATKTIHRRNCRIIYMFGIQHSVHMFWLLKHLQTFAQKRVVDSPSSERTGRLLAGACPFSKLDFT